MSTGTNVPPPSLLQEFPLLQERHTQNNVRERKSNRNKTRKILSFDVNCQTLHKNPQDRRKTAIFHHDNGINRSDYSPRQLLRQSQTTSFDNSTSALLPPLNNTQSSKSLLEYHHNRASAIRNAGKDGNNALTATNSYSPKKSIVLYPNNNTKKQITNHDTIIPITTESSEPAFYSPLYNTMPDVLSCDIMLLRDMSPGQTIDANISLALTDFSRSMYESTISRLSRTTLLRHPTSFLPHFIRGVSYYYLERHIEAKRDFTVCCNCTGRSIINDDDVIVVVDRREDYDRALAFFNRSVVWMKLNDIGKAMKDVNQAIDIYGFEKAFFSNRALLFRRRGDFESAQQDYKMMRRLEAYEMRENHREEIMTGQMRRLPSLSLGGKPNLLLPAPNHTHSSNSLISSIQSPSRCGSVRKTLLRRSTIYNGQRSPSAKRVRSQMDLKKNLYGEVNSALTRSPQNRTKTHLEVLVRESRMMPAFAHLDAKQLSTLWQFLEYESYPSNTRLFEEGDVADDYMLVWSGSVSVRVCKRNDVIKHCENVARALAMEREFTVNTMKAGETLGEAIMLEGGVRKASCVTEEPTEILILKREHFRQTFHVFLEKSHNEKVEFLSSFDFLSQWDKTKLDELAHLCREKRYHRGEIIIRQNEPANSLFFVKTGMLSLTRNVQSEQQQTQQQPQQNQQQQQPKPKSYQMCISKLSSGDVFGEETLLLHNEKRDMTVFPTTAISETLSICYRLDKIQLEQKHWDHETKKKLAARKIRFQDDATLLRCHFEQNKFKLKSALIVKKVQNMIIKKQTIKQFGR